MLSTLTLLLGLGFVVVALYRLSRAAPPPLKTAQLVLALAAGLAGIATYRLLGDSRWLVGGVLMIGAGVPGFLAGNRRTLAAVALICGMLGLALFGIATLKPMTAAVMTG